MPYDQRLVGHLTPEQRERSPYVWGFREGKKGIPYTGNTFLGYYGWLDGYTDYQEILYREEDNDF